MKKEDAGELLMHILQYVNDENPITENMVVDLVFEPIKLQMKRDLKKWEGILESKSMSGRIGNLKRWYPNLYEQYLNKEITLEDAEIIADAIKCDKSRQNSSQNVTNIAVTDTVTVTVNDTVIKESMSDKIGFEKFWELYDKKSSKIKSQKLWDKLTKEEKVIVMEHVPRYVKSTPQKQFRKDPSTYLNNKSFNDEIIERNPTLFPSQQHANTVKIVV